MQFITVSNGETSTGIVLINGDFMAVQPGGQAVSTTVIGPNFTILSVQHGGVAIASLIEGPATSIEEVDYGAADQGSIVGSGGLLETLSGGTAIVSGAVTNSGTLFASGARSLIDIVAGATVTGGGIAKIANGTIDIEGSGDNQNVVFLAGGSGTLQIADAPGNPSAFGGTVSGFGQNVHQFIDLTGVTYVAGGVVSARYSSSTTTSGVLMVTSGGTANVVAVINFSGHYVTSNFHITSGANGTVAIFDPPVIAQQSTLGFSDAPGGIGKIVDTVVSDTAAGKLALLGNYIASEFASLTNGHAGILPTEPQHTVQQPLLTHPHGR